MADDEIKAAIKEVRALRETQLRDLQRSECQRSERDPATAVEMTHAAYLTLDQVIENFVGPSALVGVLKAIRMQLQIALKAMGREP